METLSVLLNTGEAKRVRNEWLLDVPVSAKEGKIPEKSMNSQQDFQICLQILQIHN